MTEPLYSIGTWDTEEQAYTPQVGLTVPSQNVASFRECCSMNLEVRVINRETAKGLKVTLAEPPYKIIWLAKQGIEGEWRAGERDVVLPIKSWYARILSEEWWREEMRCQQPSTPSALGTNSSRSANP
jgi:hypothetical protein